MYYIFNQLTLEPEKFSSIPLAVARLAEIKPLVLERESYRFSVAYEEAAGNNTVWRAADFAVDPDDGVFFVFNTLTGMNEQIVGKQAALSRVQELKELFSKHMGLDEYTEVTDADQPIIAGAQEL